MSFGLSSDDLNDSDYLNYIFARGSALNLSADEIQDAINNAKDTILKNEKIISQN